MVSSPRFPQRDSFYTRLWKLQQQPFGFMTHRTWWPSWFGYCKRRLSPTWQKVVKCWGWWQRVYWWEYKFSINDVAENCQKWWRESCCCCCCLPGGTGTGTGESLGFAWYCLEMRCAHALLSSPKKTREILMKISKMMVHQYLVWSSSSAITTAIYIGIDLWR